MEKIEFLILRNLIHNDEYLRKVIPFINLEYFVDQDQKLIFEEINKFVSAYSEQPTKEILAIEIEKRTDLSQEQFRRIATVVSNLDDMPVEFNWLVDTTEKWCKDRAIYLALLDSIQIAEGEHPSKNRDAIPSILQEALSVSFDSHVGHDYIENAFERFEFYHRTENKIPFNLQYLDKITNGGVANKTLTVILAGTNVGKSLFMCHFAASALLQGKNVLYITLEMAEEKIAKRIDANLLDVDISKIEELSKNKFETAITKLAQKLSGNLVIKEYPTSSAHAGHFEALLNDLALKKAFKPDIIFIDYLNICSSSRISAKNTNSYSYIKSIAEELRALAVKHDVPIVSATQTNRSGFSSSDPDLTDTSESFGLPATADLMFGLISTEELEELNQILVKQLKNRDGDKSINKRFVLGIDRSKMRIYDVEESAQKELHDFESDEDITERLSKTNEKNKEKFGRFKFSGEQDEY
jgi:replicative DNA helicase